MSFYFAPMEGITGYVFRKAHHDIFGTGIERYYTPFVVANYTHRLKTRERMDVLPQNNEGISLVPQILANDAQIFLATARIMAEWGYPEVNINLGCPVGTVVSKHKGAGMLQFPDELNRFLDSVFNGIDKEPVSSVSHLRISIKTRLGFDSVREAERIFAIYEQYPISELIIHARTRKEQYDGQPELDTFLSILKNTKIPVCYNGNIATVQDYQYLRRRIADTVAVLSADLPTVSMNSMNANTAASAPSAPIRSLSVNYMIGRGLLGNPGLVREILTGQRTNKEEILTLHDHLLEGYCQQYLPDLSADSHRDRKNAKYPIFAGQQPISIASCPSSMQIIIINRMKEVWSHLGRSFSDSSRYLKGIHKAKNYAEYAAAVRMLFANCDIVEPASGLWVKS